jgi:hypothetical protein
MTIAQIILGFLKTLLSWPAVLFWISLIILIKYVRTIEIFIEEITKKITKLKYGKFEAELLQQKVSEKDGSPKEEDLVMKERIENLLKEKDESRGQIEKSKEIIKYLEGRVKGFEFAYLSLWLNPNSKRALQWFSPGHTKKEFIEQFKILPIKIFQSVEDAKNEKEVIFNALSANRLIISQSDGRFIPTEKGKELLNYFITYGFL